MAQVRTEVPDDLKARISAYARGEGVSEAALVRAILGKAFAQLPIDVEPVADTPASTRTAVLKTKVAPQVSRALQAHARTHGTTASGLLRKLVMEALGATAQPENPAVQSSEPAGRGGRQVLLRLWGDELAAVERLAAAESRSVPAWIVALIRNRALQVMPFCSEELRELRAAIACLGPLGRNVNALAKQWQQGTRVPAQALPVMELKQSIARLRNEVLTLAERASNRYGPHEGASRDVKQVTHRQPKKAAEKRGAVRVQ